MHLVVIGVNHKTAPVGLREKLCISEESLADALCGLRARPPISECLILSTCNRTEVYACLPTRADDTEIIDWISEFSGVRPDDLAGHLYSQPGHKAVEHLFHVAAGVDSMVIGEAQILGQVKNAYAVASQVGSTGAVLNALFQHAITVGKRVRTQTEIGRGAFSVGSVAVQLARSIFDDLKKRAVLVVGAGKMSELAMTHLMAAGTQTLMVANRTYEKAAELAARFDGRPVKFEELASALAGADIVITSTGSTQPIVTRDMVSSVMRARRGRPVFLVDIAVPRDVEPGVRDIDNVFLYDIDDLQTALASDIATRRSEVEKAEPIIVEEVEQFMLRFRTFDAVPIITAMRDKFEGIRAAETDKLRARLSHLSPEDLEAINTTTRSIVNKICHQPMIQIKEYAVADNPPAKLETICDLFGICLAENETERD